MRLGAFLVTGAVTLLAGLARTSSYPVALTRDTGQMLYGGDVVLHGGTPYADAALSKGPVTYLFSAALRIVAGRSALDVRLVLLACAIVTGLAIWRYLERVSDSRSAVLAALAFAALAAIAIFEGEDPDLEQFAVAPIAIALWLSSQEGTVAAAMCGAITALAGLLSPVFLIPLVPAAVWTMRRQGGPLRARLLVASGAGLVVAFGVWLWLWLGGAFPSFFHQFPGTLGAPPDGALFSPARLVAVPARGLWIASLGLGIFALTRPRLRGAAVCGIGWIIASWARVKFGDRFAHDPDYDHHYYPVLIGMSAAIGLGLSALWSAQRRAVALAVSLALACGLLIPLVIVPEVDAYKLPVGIRGIGQNPWSDAVPVARWINAHTGRGARIYVCGSEPQVYWLADRLSSTRLFDSYAISAYHPYLQELLRDLNADPPTAIAALSFDSADAYIRQIIVTHHYRVAYRSAAGEVWLAPGVATRTS